MKKVVQFVLAVAVFASPSWAHAQTGSTGAQPAATGFKSGLSRLRCTVFNRRRLTVVQGDKREFNFPEAISGLSKNRFGSSRLHRLWNTDRRRRGTGKNPDCGSWRPAGKTDYRGASRRHNGASRRTSKRRQSLRGEEESLRRRGREVLLGCDLEATRWRCA